MTTTTFPPQVRPRTLRLAGIALVFTVGGAIGVSAGLLLSDDDATPSTRAAVASVESAPASADAVERWAEADTATGVPMSADAVERWAEGGERGTCDSTVLSADALERCIAAR